MAKKTIPIVEDEKIKTFIDMIAPSIIKFNIDHFIWEYLQMRTIRWITLSIHVFIKSRSGYNCKLQIDNRT